MIYVLFADSAVSIFRPNEVYIRNKFVKCKVFYKQYHFCCNDLNIYIPVIISKSLVLDVYCI